MIEEGEETILSTGENMMVRRRFQAMILFAGSASLLLLFTASESLADRNVNANEAIVISDDIRNETTDVVSVSGSPFSGFGDGDTPASGGGDDGDDGTADSGPGDNNSGLGDGTNPGQGEGQDNSPNQGTNNPNNSGGDGGGPPH